MVTRQTSKRTPEELKQEFLSNLTKLWEAAASGTDNSVSELFAETYDAKVKSLAKVVMSQKNGAELTAADREQIGKEAKEWARTKGFEELKNALAPTDDKGNPLETAGKFMEVWEAFDKGGMLKGIMSIAKNFKEWVSAVVESRNSDESIDVIRARKDIESAAARFAAEKKALIKPTQFLAELRMPSAESTALAQPPAAPPPVPTVTSEQQAAADKAAKDKAAAERAAAQAAEIQAADAQARHEERIKIARERAASEERAAANKGKKPDVGAPTNVGHDDKAPAGTPVAAAGSQQASL